MTYLEYTRKLRDLEEKIVASKEKEQDEVQRVIFRDEQKQAELRANLDRVKQETTCEINQTRYFMQQEIRNLRSVGRDERKALHTQVTELKNLWELQKEEERLKIGRTRL